MTDSSVAAPAEVTPSPAPKAGDWARYEAAKPVAPAPQYLSIPEIKAMTDPAALTAALNDGRVGSLSRNHAVERLATLLTSGAGAVGTSAGSAVVGDKLSDWSLPPTDAEAERMAGLEREAFAGTPGLATDYKIPGDHPSVGKDALKTNEAIRQSLFAAQVPVGVANTVIAGVARIAEQLQPLDDAGRAELTDMRSKFVREYLQEKWGADFGPRITAVKSYLKASADTAHAAGQSWLREILTNSPELLDDPASIETLYNACLARR